MMPTLCEVELFCFCLPQKWWRTLLFVLKKSFCEVFHEKVAKVAERFQYLSGSELPFSPFRAWAGYGFLDPKKQQLSLAFGTSSAAWGRALWYHRAARCREANICKILCSKKWSYPQETNHFQGIPTIWISSFVRSMLSYQRTSPFQQVIYASVVVQHRLMSYASSSALWKGMAAPIGMINCGTKKTKFLAKFGSFQHPWNIFVPIPNCMIEPNISRYWTYCSIVWSSFVWNAVVCRISNNFNWDSPVFPLQNFWLGVCLFDPISGTCNLGKGWHEPICLDREWCSCGEDGEDDKVKKFWGPPKHPKIIPSYRWS